MGAKVRPADWVYLPFAHVESLKLRHVAVEGVSKQNRNRNRKSKSFRFRELDVVSKQNQNVKGEMQPNNMGELQPTRRSKL